MPKKARTIDNLTPDKKVQYTTESLSEHNIGILAELVADPATTDHLKVTIINKLLEAQESQSFFETMYVEGLSFGACPECGHENHWGIPEDNLNELDWITYQKDSRVAEIPTAEECPEFQQACAKKKITF